MASKLIPLLILLAAIVGSRANADDKNLLLGIWKPIEVWADGTTQDPQRDHFKLYVNERKQWSLGDWPAYPDLSDASITDERYGPQGLPKGTPVLPKHFDTWTTIEEELGIMVLSLLRSDKATEQRTIKKFVLRGDKLFVLQVSSTWQPAKKWWGYAERHGDLGGGFYVGKYPSAGPKQLPESDRIALAALKVPATHQDTTEGRLSKSMTELKSAGKPIIPRMKTEVVVYERETTEPKPE